MPPPTRQLPANGSRQRTHSQIPTPCVGDEVSVAQEPPRSCGSLSPIVGKIQHADRSLPGNARTGVSNGRLVGAAGCVFAKIGDARLQRSDLRIQRCDRRGYSRNFRSRRRNLANHGRYVAWIEPWLSARAASLPSQTVPSSGAPCAPASPAAASTSPGASRGPPFRSFSGPAPRRREFQPRAAPERS